MTNPFRVTHRSVGIRTLQGLQSNLEKVTRLQEQLSSGKQITRPSDSPTGTVSAMRLRGEVRTNEQYSRNADDGIGWLATIDDALTGSLSNVRRVRELTLTGMSTGASTPESRQALAVEVEQLREHLISVANTTYLDRPVFGGTTPGSVAYDKATGAFVGDRNAVNRTVGDGVEVRVDITGPEVFGEGDTELFTVLADIAKSLKGNPSALAGDLGRLDTAMRTMQNRLADVGTRYARVEQSRQTASDRVLGMRGDLSAVEDIDLPKTIVDLQMQEAAYQAALGATRKVVQPSLVEFLR